ncbi:hypothetical protein SAY87_006456 [Trapa incisa]|uniref:Dof zinc finger protein n=1 Tax=Trapa incisa TaxID=236973 RepID=A0AAN7K113_9MYRT|nr:hypothetical protein SAY87_006456 [Trapa incisa]
MMMESMEFRDAMMLGHLQQKVLKCPRCDSTNTKFCYYNNYNLSQPRHFCRSCRRYWTKGGVLRNIPVGGGSRKNKRSKASKIPPPPEQLLDREEAASDVVCQTSATASSPPPKKLPERRSSSHSCTSRQSSSLTAATVVSGHSTEGARYDAKIGHRAVTGAFTGIENLTGLITASTTAGAALSQRNDNETREQQPWKNLTDENNIFDQTVQMDFHGEALWPSDWQIKDQGLLDVPTTVDQAYWSEGQSPSTDPSLYLP